MESVFFIEILNMFIKASIVASIMCGGIILLAITVGVIYLVVTAIKEAIEVKIYNNYKMKGQK